MIQPIVSNQTGEVNQQLIISKPYYYREIFFKNLRNINKQVLETKYTSNLGQLLWMILDIKRYIFNLVPSKFTLVESIITSIAIDHHNNMAII